MPGFPIRTSSDPRSVGSSPRHIAASHVLHRLSMPRHPPCALKHLQTQKPRNKNCKTNKTPALLVRCSQPLSTKQTPHPTTKMERQHTHPRRGENGPVASGPNSVPRQSRPTPPPKRPRRLVIKAVVVQINLHHRTTHYRRRRKISQPHHPHPCEERGNMVLLRKEVIQPHLPVRLPCYDFVPIADPTFDGSLHKG